jgi:hypothetical protein
LKKSEAALVVTRLVSEKNYFGPVPSAWGRPLSCDLRFLPLNADSAAAGAARGDPDASASGSVDDLAWPATVGAVDEDEEDVEEDDDDDDDDVGLAEAEAEASMSDGSGQQCNCHGVLLDLTFCAIRSPGGAFLPPAVSRPSPGVLRKLMMLIRRIYMCKLMTRGGSD